MSGAFPTDLVLTPVSRWPTTLPDDSIRAVLRTPIAHSVSVPTAGASRPRVSIVVVTYDGLVFTRLCLETVLAIRSSVDFEVIVVDNGSTDGTVEYLLELTRADRRIRLELLERNLGFACATNLAVALSHGDVVVLLNNDTIPMGGWLDRLVNHLDDQQIGLLGAVTNRAGNEAEITVPYRTYGELEHFATGYARAHAGELFDIRTATMFCAALRRDVWSAIGPLDERFEVGLFEDDDYAMRVRAKGFRVACAEDLFVHHFGQASIGRLGSTGEYGALFHANRARWEAKWGIPWQPYERRPKPSYQALVQRFRRLVCETVPADATVLVISKGDAQLLNLEGRRAWHFPQSENGAYAGHHPANDDECLAELERLRAKGATYLAIPAPAMWWLEHYRRFAQYLQTQCRMVLSTPDGAVLLCQSTGESGAQSAGFRLLRRGTLDG
jgi:GT2 family glycosyltransferase